MSRPSSPSKRSRRTTLQARCELLEDRPLMNVQFTIDPLRDIRPISRYIYGINQQLPGYSNFTLQRLGGNLTSAWNWVTGNSNAGRDYYYQNESLSYFTGGTTGPGGAAIPMLQADKAQNAATLLTVPINGYVAANEADDSVLNNAVTTVPTAVSATATVIPVANAAAIPTTPYYIVVRGEEMEVTGIDLAHNQLTVVRGISGGNVALKANDAVYLAPDVRNAGANFLQTQFEQALPTKPGGPGSFTLTPDPNSPYVYADEFVNWVNKTFPNGQTNPNTPIWYELDNEPDIWNSSHTELQPNAVTYAQLLQESIAYAKAIKSVAPNTMVFGPVSYGWEGFVSLQNAPDASGRNWLEYYLQQMQQASAGAGQRLLDTLDIHFYTSTPDDPASTVQAPRSLWDPSYMENSWIAQSIPGAIDLLPRLQADINTYYPGTKLAISEYNYGSGDDIFGAIAQADALGIFGVQGLYAATEWQLSSDESYIGAAFDMFRNFDGKSGTFGDNSVLASTNDVNDSSIYASVDSANSNMMTLVAINKSTQALPATMHLDHVQPGATAAIYQLTAGSTTPHYVGTVTITDPSNFTYTMPGSSITTIRIVSPGAPANAPGVATAAHASPTSVTGVSTNLGAVGTDANGESNLTYTWSTTTAPALVGFSINGTNAAKNTVATFSAPGNYSFLVTIRNGGGYFATSRVDVTVSATLTHITVRPSQTTTAANGMQRFTATATDQFGNPLAAQPNLAWSATAGSISTAGIFSAPATAGNVTINASAVGIQGSTSITVVAPTSIVVSAATDSALRNAIATANADAANGTSVTVLFAPALAGHTITVGPIPLELKSGTGAVRIEGGNLITLSGGSTAQVFKIDAGAHVTLDGLTITKGAAGAGNGGGIYMENGGYDPKPTSLTLRNCIVAGNTSDQPGPDLFVSSGTLTGAYNLIGIGTGVTGIANNTNGNQVGTSAAPLKPLLATLANNGGPTQTMALQPGSPAIAGGAAVTMVSEAVPNATATSLTVANGNRIAVTNPPAGTGYVLVLDGETMLVTAVSGNTLTVQRGYKGTKATSHAPGAAVYLGTDQRGAITPTTVPDLGAFQTTTHLVVTKNPMNLTADAGQTVTFNAAARGGNLNVQWQTSTDGGKSWTNVAGATAKTVVTINGLPTTTTALSRSTTLSLNGREYRVTFASSVGSIISGPARLTVHGGAEVDRVGDAVAGVEVGLDDRVAKGNSAMHEVVGGRRDHDGGSHCHISEMIGRRFCRRSRRCGHRHVDRSHGSRRVDDHDLREGIAVDGGRIEAEVHSRCAEQVRAGDDDPGSASRQPGGCADARDGGKRFVSKLIGGRVGRGPVGRDHGHVDRPCAPRGTYDPDDRG